MCVSSWSDFFYFITASWFGFWTLLLYFVILSLSIYRHIIIFNAPILLSRWYIRWLLWYKGGVTYRNVEFYEISHHNLLHKVTLSMPKLPIFDILMKISLSEALHFLEDFILLAFRGKITNLKKVLNSFETISNEF